MAQLSTFTMQLTRDEQLILQLYSDQVFRSKSEILREYIRSLASDNDQLPCLKAKLNNYNHDKLKQERENSLSA